MQSGKKNSKETNHEDKIVNKLPILGGGGYEYVQIRPRKEECHIKQLSGRMKYSNYMAKDKVLK